MRIAIATKDGRTVCSSHFGDADYYLIYNITESQAVEISKVENISPEEKMHADPEKAKGVGQIMRSQGVECAVCKVFGPNIRRVAKLFVPVLTNEESIDKVIATLQQTLDPLEALVGLGNKAFKLDDQTDLDINTVD